MIAFGKAINSTCLLMTVGPCGDHCENTLHIITHTLHLQRYIFASLLLFVFASSSSEQFLFVWRNRRDL